VSEEKNANAEKIMENLEEVEEELAEEKVEEQVEENDNDIQKCIGFTVSNDKCKNVATFPEDNPLYCHHHKHQFQEKDLEKKDTEDLKNFIGQKKHVFASQHLSHILFIDCPAFSEKGFIRIEFEGGRYETNNDKIAELIMKQMREDDNLNRKLTKVQ